MIACHDYLIAHAFSFGACYPCWACRPCFASLLGCLLWLDAVSSRSHAFSSTLIFSKMMKITEITNDVYKYY